LRLLDTEPEDIAVAALDYARKHYHDVLIVDTAGRLAIDDAMMQESGDCTSFGPDRNAIVVDAMQGQDAVNVAKVFSEHCADRRYPHQARRRCAWCAALSVRQVTAVRSNSSAYRETLGSGTVLSRATGRTHPGHGDVLALVEEARATSILTSRETRQESEVGKGFDLDDFRNQMRQMKKMGGLNALIDKLPAQLHRWPREGRSTTA